jgi:hypothetical protein
MISQKKSGGGNGENRIGGRDGGAIVSVCRQWLGTDRIESTSMI